MDARSLMRPDRPVPTRRFSRRSAAGGLAIGSLVGFLSRVGLAMNRTLDATPSADGAPQPFLFVQTASGGGFEPSSDAADSFILTLRPVGGHTFYFADHPGREAGILPTEAFPTAVPFDPVDPPNAALVIDGDAGEQVAVLTLTEPSYEAASDALTYQVRFLSPAAWDALSPALAVLSPEAAPIAFGMASLFIDGLAAAAFNNTRVIQKFDFFQHTNE